MYKNISHSGIFWNSFSMKILQSMLEYLELDLIRIRQKIFGLRNIIKLIQLQKKLFLMWFLMILCHKCKFWLHRYLLLVSKTYFFLIKRYPKSINIWNRRKNLIGTTFQAISGVWAPFITNIIENENSPNTIEGFYAEIWQELSKRLNFTTKITKLPSNVTSGRWSYMVDAIGDKKYDLLLSGSSQTLSRSLTSDFSLPMQMSTVRFASVFIVLG